MEPGFRRRCCKALGISKSSFYAPPTKQTLKDKIAIGELVKVHLEDPYYGVVRLSYALGWSFSKTRRIRNLAGVQAKLVRKKHRYRKSLAEIPAPNNLTKDLAVARDTKHPWRSQDFSNMASPNNRIWVQDFTYIKTRQGVRYVAMVLQLSTREIVGWSLGKNHSAELTRNALLDALSKRKAPDILHNDRGSEYLSFAMEQTCRLAGIKMSASSPNSPWQNGFCERIMNTIKNEGESLYSMPDTAHLVEEIAIRIYKYNNKRIHKSLKMAPSAYAALNNIN